VDGNVDAGLLLILVQDVVDLLDWLVMTGVSGTKDNEDTNGVLVNVLLDELWVKPVLRLGADWKDASLYLEVASELCYLSASRKKHQETSLLTFSRAT